ncbi:MAG: nitroreductase family protein [Gammaproteobacteria bacterium]|nr:nitroreductase family protein [Gammaproteobacteria bacterium]
MDLYEVMRTTFAAREHRREEIDDDTIYRILDNARFAPSGGNRQGWRVIIIRDDEKRNALGPLISPVMLRYRAMVVAGENPYNTIEPSSVTVEDIEDKEMPEAFLNQFTQAPVLLLILVDLKVVASMDYELDRVGVISGASIYPFAWNILLAARNEGLGGTLTTFLSAREPEVKRLFAIPDDYAVCALLPIGKPVKQLTKLRRKEVSEFATIDSFDGMQFSA